MITDERLEEMLSIADRGLDADWGRLVRELQSLRSSGWVPKADHEREIADMDGNYDALFARNQALVKELATCREQRDSYKMVAEAAMSWLRSDPECPSAIAILAQFAALKDSHGH